MRNRVAAIQAELFSFRLAVSSTETATTESRQGHMHDVAYLSNCLYELSYISRIYFFLFM